MKTGKLNKKGIAGLNMIPAITLALLVGFIFLAVGGQVLEGYEDSQTTATCIEADDNANCSAAFNMSKGGANAIIEFSNFGTVLGLIAVAVVILVLLAVGLGRLTGRV